MHRRRAALFVGALLLVFAASGSLGAAPAQADVCDSVPSIPGVPNPVKTGCNAAARVAGAGPKAIADPKGAAADLVTAPIRAAGDEVMQGVTTWVAKGAGWLIGQAGKLISETTTPRIGSPWFGRQYRTMASLAVVFAVPLLLLSVLQGVLKRDGGVIVRAAFVQLPAAFLLTAIAVTVVQLLLQLTDQMSAAVAGSVGNDANEFFEDTGKALGGVASATGAGAAPLFAVFLAALIAAAGAFCVWLELLVRAAAIYVAVLFLPFTFVAMIWPGTARWCRRLVEMLLAIVFAKFVIVAIMALAAAGLGQSRGDEAFQGVLAGAALMVLAAFSPFVLLKLIPFAESATVGVGWRRGPLGGAVVGPVASSMVMRRVMDSRSGGGGGGGGGLRAAPADSAGGGGGAAGGSAAAGGAVAAGAAAAQTVGGAARSRATGIGSYSDLGSAGAGGGSNGASGGSRPAVEGAPPARPETAPAPEAPAPRPRDREGGLGGG